MEAKLNNSVELRGKIRSFMVDRTLTIAGAAADAKATGDAIVNAAVGEGVIETKVKQEVNAAVKTMTREQIVDICK